MYALQKRVAQLEQAKKVEENQHLTWFDDGKIEFYLHSGKTRTYIPLPTPAQFHADDSPFRLILGPIGSGKSVADCMEIILRACKMPQMNDGVRRSKFLFIRNTYDELKNTTFSTWADWTRDFGFYQSWEKPMRTRHRFRDQYGWVEIEIIGIGLDSPNVLGKLESLELTGVFCNETKNLLQAVVETAHTRTGRYPKLEDIPRENWKYDDKPYWNGLFGDTNCPDEDHWIVQKFEIEQPKGWKIFKQPGAVIWDEEKQEYLINPNAENIRFSDQDEGKGVLPSYYMEKIPGRSQQWIRVYYEAKYGVVEQGKPVYPEFNDAWHCSDKLRYEPTLPLLLGWDFGLTPAVVICQQDAQGRLIVLAEVTTDGLGLDNFLRSKVIPFLNQNFPGYTIGLSVADPAGAKRSEADETTCYQILKQYNIETKSAPSNFETPRLEAVRWYLNNNIDGVAAIRINRLQCKVLRKGFLGAYKYKRLKVSGEVYGKHPDKDVFESHIHDALQYIALKLNMGKSADPPKVRSPRRMPSI